MESSSSSPGAAPGKHLEEQPEQAPRRYPRLVPYPHIIEALAKRAHLDHVFSCACDHPMNLFLEFDLLYGRRRG